MFVLRILSDGKRGLRAHVKKSGVELIESAGGSQAAPEAAPLA